MLTPRGWWLLLTVLATLVLAELGLSGLSAEQPLYLSELPHTTAALLGLTLGLWLAAE